MSEYIHAELSREPLSAESLRRNFHIPPDCGGFVLFEGIVRNHNEGKAVLAIEYEAYELLAVSELERIISEAKEHWPIRKAYVKHRLGYLNIGDTAVVTLVAAPHRKEAFLANQFLIDELKKRVPIWKKEHYQDGSTAWTYCQHQDHKEEPWLTK